MRRHETNWVPPDIPHVLNGQRVRIAGSQQFVMFLALVAMLVVRKVLRANAALERLLNGVEDIGVGRFHLIAIVAAVSWFKKLPICR